MQLLQYLLVLHFTFCLLWMIFSIKYCKEKSYFSNFASEQYITQTAQSCGHSSD